MTNSISCPICNNLCSAQAAACPRCGHPFPKTTTEQKYLIPYPVLMVFKTLANLSFALVLFGGVFLLFGGIVSFSSGELGTWLFQKGIWSVSIFIIGLFFYGLFTFLIYIGKKSG